MQLTAPSPPFKTPPRSTPPKTAMPSCVRKVSTSGERSQEWCLYVTKVGNIATAEIPIFMPPGGYPNAASQKFYCPFRVVAKQNLDGIWNASIPEERGHHNHTCPNIPEAHAAHQNGRLRAEPQAHIHIQRLLDSEASISLIINEMKEEHSIALTKRDVCSMKYKNKEKEKEFGDVIP